MGDLPKIKHLVSCTYILDYTINIGRKTNNTQPCTITYKKIMIIN